MLVVIIVPIVVTLVGIVTDVNAVHCLNACKPEDRMITIIMMTVKIMVIVIVANRESEH